MNQTYFFSFLFLKKLKKTFKIKLFQITGFQIKNLSDINIMRVVILRA